MNWKLLAAGVVMMCFMGNLYANGLWAPQLRAWMQWNETQIGIVTACGNLGNYLAVFIGLLADRLGGMRTILVSACLEGFGYALLFVLTRLGPFSFSFLIAGFGMFAVGQGVAGAYAAIMTTVLAEYPEDHRGKVMGFLIMWMGISAALLALLYYVFHLTFSSFLLLLGCILFTVNGTGSLFLPSTPVSARSVDSAPHKVFHFRDIVVDLRFWTLFACMFVGAGSGLTAINKIGALSVSLDAPSWMSVPLVIVLSVGNALGRVSLGFAADYVHRRWGLFRGYVFFLAIGMMGIALLVLAVPSLYTVLFGAFCLGVAYGAIAVTSPMVTSLVFGIESFGEIWGVMISSSGVSSVVLGMSVSMIADIQALPCRGGTCFAPSYLFLSVLCFVTAGFGFLTLKFTDVFQTNIKQAIK